MSLAVKLFYKPGLSKEFKRGNWVSLFDSCVNAMGSGHFDSHVWRWVIVPLDLARSFSVICAHYCCWVFYHMIPKCMRDLIPHEKSNTRLMKLLGGLSYEKSRRYNNSPPYVMVRWPSQQIPPPPLNFLGLISYFLDISYPPLSTVHYLNF